MGTVEGVIAVIGMAVLVLLSRGFFFLSRKGLPFPPWLRGGLRHAPLAALAAVVAPEIVITQDQLIQTWADARIWSAAAAAGWFFWRRDILGTIVAGMVVMLGLRLGLGW